MVTMSSTGCFQSGGLNMLDKFILPVVPLLHSYKQPNFTQHGALPPFSFPVRACVLGWTIGILIGGLGVENQQNSFR